MFRYADHRLSTLLFCCFVVLVLSLVPAAWPQAEIVRGPYLGDVTDTSIVIAWETERPVQGVVEYATEASYQTSRGKLDQRVQEAAAVQRHFIRLRDLEPSTRYYYRVGNALAVREGTFRTAVGWGEPFTLVVYGDTRTNPADHLAVVHRILEHNPDLIVNAGDLVADGRVLSQWDTFFQTTAEILKDVPYYPVLGNHERNAAHYYDLFSLPQGGGRQGEQWYSFDYGNVHFVCLDSNARSSAEQLAWLEDDLAHAANNAQWIFVFFHHPPYSSGNHGGRADVLLPWLDAFERYGVDIVFNGHDHTYERSVRRGIWYLVTGGGGAPRYAVNSKPNPYQVYAESSLHFCKLTIEGERLSLQMIRADGAIGDRMTLTAPVPVASVTKLPVTWARLKMGW